MFADRCSSQLCPGPRCILALEREKVRLGLRDANGGRTRTFRREKTGSYHYSIAPEPVLYP